LSIPIDTGLLDEIKKYGAINPEACISCGNCSAICPLTSSEHSFPRRTIRMIQTGLRGRLLASIDPWLCYFCGDCSQTCPKGAEPAETMMAARRWLIAQYDQSGKARKLYTSEKAIALALIRAALVPLLLLVAYHLLTGGRNIQTSHVALNQFAPVLWVWALVLLHFAFLGLHIIRNSMEMTRNVLGSQASLLDIPVSAYLLGIKDFALHFLSQRQWWSKCDETRRVEFSRWVKHLLLMTGYVTMLILIVPLLWWFQTDKIYPLYNPQRWLGYYATFILIFTSLEIIVSRIMKQEQMHRFSHPSDWLFPGFLLIGAVTGILVHSFRYLGLPWPTYILYTVHVMAMIAMLDTEVGIGKWTHLIYRPLALSLEAMKQKTAVVAPRLLPAGAD
jgi:ferredoxin